MENKIGLIVTTQTQIDLKYFEQEKFFIVGVERGCLDLMNKKVRIDLAISDFDQVSQEELAAIKSYATKVEVLKTDKNEIDGFAAIKYLANLGITKTKFIAKATKRYDMNLSIIDLINQFDVEIFNEETIIKKIPAGKSEIKYEPSRFVSFYTLVDNNQITLKNLKFETNQLEAKLFSTRFVSNEFLLNENAIIETKYPVMMIIVK